MAVLKTIAAFLNMKGGTLIIGVADDGDPVGIEADGFPSEDKMNLHLVNLIKDRISASSMLYIFPRFDDYQEARIMMVDCLPAKSPIFVKDGAVGEILRAHRSGHIRTSCEPDAGVYKATLRSVGST